ncbi:MerR family transcriptional regulator [Clostridium saccharoperbutylacetonicum]
MKYYTIGQFSKLVWKSNQTLRLWENKGKLKLHHIREGRHHYYSEQQINKVLQVPLVNITKKVIGYCRISSDEQKDDYSF